ncbi:succinylglutamate desuccinylase/aspartoacylase family protein [Halogeometricum sp. S1BR25-6]|uniref:Succinylglutamate desuccinylase/aspartoacylase family protein n=1 Tax=Halogeometricum salsisoli TaxID=2950536 RepID=A0ABU2GG61_9EURY|nr:succinylglutamate desuccinylase/aspartoacylase family protein [Halogeometricum sp. S1BR25-6]MDS0299787.1 succinylglutamate desuccinylase/aspartoacylase family protein [Halogeometricum sp. S1BR25-6]
MHTAETVTLARLPSGIDVETTVHTYGSGDDDGPTVYVQAAQHGREINGTETLRRVHERLDSEELSGTLVAVPVADPLTFDRSSYTTPESLDSVHSNMNRVWPGDAEGSLHERMAAALWEYAGEVDYIVDLHTGSPEMLTHTVYLQGDTESRRLAEAFGTDLLLAEAAGDDRKSDDLRANQNSPGSGDDADVEWSERNFGGKLRVAATRRGIPSITPELAHNKQLVEPAIETGVRGVFNVLRELDMLPSDPELPAEQTTARNHLGRVTAADSGLFHAAPDAELGREVAEGDHLGRVYDPTTYEVLQEATADRAGVVYSVCREATVTAGQTLVGVAMPLDGA